MNLLDALTDYLAPVMGDAKPWLGMWDESPGMEDVEFLSINFELSPRPGVISKYKNIELWYVGPRNGADIEGGKSDAFSKALAISDYITENPTASRCFANVVSLSGIIGPKETEHLRQAYLIPIEITY